MKILKFNRCTLTLRCPWITIKSEDVLMASIHADTIIGFWKYRIPRYLINWQLSVLVLGFGFQLTDEHPDPDKKHRKANVLWKDEETKRKDDAKISVDKSDNS